MTGGGYGYNSNNGLQTKGGNGSPGNILLI
jgi:hypothetical protein